MTISAIFNGRMDAPRPVPVTREALMAYNDLLRALTENERHEINLSRAEIEQIVSAAGKTMAQLSEDFCSERDAIESRRARRRLS